jgi:hypothetical protein
MLILNYTAMNSKRRGSAPKSTNKSNSNSSLKIKRTNSPALKDSKKKVNVDTVNVKQLAKKSTGQQLLKKKIEDLKPPELIIKISYRGKRISIPIQNCDDKGLSETVLPHIIRFENEILSNQLLTQIILLSCLVPFSTGRPLVEEIY